jgi:3-hydroxyacyl-[acyl-carrier-protein] dehydratase
MRAVKGEEFDLAPYDLEKVAYDTAQVMEIIPHRDEMLLLDGIHHVDTGKKIIIGYRDIKEGEFWTRGHFPGRPMFPGVLMIETAAQLCAVGFKLFVPEVRDRIIAFGGIDNVRFRGQVGPGKRMTIAVKGDKVSRRACRGPSWGWVDGQVVFEATILGIPV